ncbi:MAG TPA: copper homeostasis protein CutC [Terriglobia bacterium]|nr:copper homeostasis protein CutC [Terriglobia bacterium]
MKSPFSLEICCDSIDSVLAAQRGGAQRIELCSSLLEGGLTPSAGFIRTARASTSIALFVMIRPRGGDFCNSDAEFAAMKEDISVAKSSGADGVVLGFLSIDGNVDVARTAALVQLAAPLPVTFHRAFDLTADLDRSLEDVIKTGAQRILTSGGTPVAPEGVRQIKRLVETAGERIRIMAGSGIHSKNVAEVIATTRVHEIHASAKAPVPSPMRFQRNVSMGSTANDEYTRFVANEAEVRALAGVLRDLEGAAR